MPGNMLKANVWESKDNLSRMWNSHLTYFMWWDLPIYEQSKETSVSLCTENELGFFFFTVKIGYQ